MPAGKYDKLVTIERSTETRSQGDVVETWATLRRCWASVEGLTTRERLQAQQTQSAINVKVKLRESVAGLTQKDRVTHLGRVFNIDGIQGEHDRNPRHGQMLWCSEVM